MHDFDRLVQQVREHSFDGDRRRYHRFRTTQDEAVADCVGSNLRCAHDWGWCEGILDDPAAGRFYSPHGLVNELEQRCQSDSLDAIRLTGMEPIMADHHLVEVIDQLDDSITVRIDTNGMLLTHNYISRFNGANDLEIRLSFKGSNPENFSRLASVGTDQFQRQIDAFRACIAEDVSLDSVLVGVFGEEERDELREKLQPISGKHAAELELEKLRYCPENRKKLQERGFDVSPGSG